MIERKKERKELMRICAYVFILEKIRREQTVIFSVDWQGLKCRCFSVFRVLSSLMVSADNRGQTSHLHNSFHFRAPDKCLQTRRLSVKSEYFSSSPAARRFGELNQRSISFFFMGGVVCRGKGGKAPNQAQKKDGGKKAIE